MVKIKLPRLFLFVIISFLIFSFREWVDPTLGLAQTGLSPQWSEPVNLSHSGGAANPIAVVDQEQRIHIIWQDSFRGLRYVEGNLESWSAPVSVKLPLGKENVTLAVGANNMVHAFWNDEKGALWYSAVQSNQFSNPGSWLPPQMLTISSADYAVTVDQEGVVHLAYIKNLKKEEDKEIPPDEITGVYYQKFSGGWTNPKLVYQSEYYRALSKQEANVQIAVGGGQDTLYLAWDDMPRRRVFMARSLDGGVTWNDIQEVDDPSKQLGAETPFNIRLQAHPQGIVRLWQRGLPGEYCSQYFQYSADQGETWSDPELMFAELNSCPQENELFNQFEEFIFLQSKIQNQNYWLVFKEGKWSEPKLQNELSGFTNPDTLLDVQFDCGFLLVVKPDTVIHLGCERGIGDIWLQSRKIGGSEDWFPPPSIWTELVALNNPMTGQISHPVLVADKNNRLHAFWTQHDEKILSPKEDQLYYALWDGIQWTKPLPILSLVDITVLQPYAVELTEDDRLLVVWNGKPTGTIYFSWANASRAFLDSEWAEPVAIKLTTTDQIYENSPFITLDRSGNFLVAYTVSINEGRGIYLIQSSDKGKTWSDPVQIFDGNANQWEVIDPAKLAIGSENSVHAIFGRQESPFVNNIENIYYARKTPNETDWRLSGQLYDSQSEGESITWFKLLTDFESGLHIIWQTKSPIGPAYVWHQFSPDDGLTFAVSPSLQRFSETVGLVDASVDPSGILHLILVDQTVDGRLFLRNQQFADRKWDIVENIDLSSPQKFILKSMAATFTQDGFLGVLLIGEKVGEGLENQDLILFAERLPTQLIETSNRQQRTTLPEAVTPTVTPTADRLVKSTPTATSIVLPSGLMKIAPQTAGRVDPWIIGPLIGGGIALAVVVIVFVRSIRLAQDRSKDS